MRVPMMSAGSRSGVSCTRWNFAEIALAIVVAVSVLATPGTPSSSKWPHPARGRPCDTANGIAAKSAVSILLINVCCPTITLPISRSSPVTISPAACVFNACCSITPSEIQPQQRDRAGRDHQRHGIEIAILRRRAVAHQLALAGFDLLQRLGQVAAGARAQVAAARIGRQVAKHPLFEPRADDASGFVAERNLASIGLQLGHRHLVVRSNADAVDVMPFLAIHRELAVYFAAVVLAVREQHENLAGLAIVFAGDLQRVLQRRADVGAHQVLRIAFDPVQVKGDGVEIAREIRQDQRAPREPDQPDAVDVLRLVLEERADLLSGARESRRRHVVGAHRRGSIEHDHEVLALVLRDAGRQRRLRADERKDERATGDGGQDENCRVAQPRRPARQRSKARGHGSEAALPMDVEKADGTSREQHRQDLPPRRELGPKETHATRCAAGSWRPAWEAAAAASTASAGYWAACGVPLTAAW